MHLPRKSESHTNGTILSLQYLRAVAATMVLFPHILTKFDQIYGADHHWIWPKGGSAGIDLFFLISGFIITHVGWRYHRREGYALRFLRKRIIRIVPIYWFWTTIALGVFLLLPGNVNSSGGVTSIIHSYLFLPGDSKYLIENGWSLSYELFFYGLFALALCLPRRSAYPLLAMGLMAACATGMCVPFESAPLRFFTNGLLLEFLAGMALYGLYHRGWTLPTPLALAVALWGVAEIFYLGWIDAAHPQVYHGIPAACILYGAVSLEHWFQRWPQQWWISLGNASYSLYITHPFVLKGVAIALVSQGGPPDLPYPVVGVAMLVLSFAFGWLAYVVVERSIHQVLIPRVGATVRQARQNALFPFPRRSRQMTTTPAV